MHIPVLLKEVTDNLPIQEGEILVDGTVGNGGHSKAVAEKSGKTIVIVGLDLDSEALERARVNLFPVSPKLILEKINFRNLDQALAKNNLGKAAGIIVDLGFSSEQIEISKRGFSFQKDEPLLMTLDNTILPDVITAKEIVNNWEEKNLETIIRNYGEEKQANKIAKAIVASREKKPIETSRQLAEIIEKAVRRSGKIHPATKTFQALRIAVNDELGALEEFLPKAVSSLKEGGRLAIISFHSLEDRIVKHFGKNAEKQAILKIITKKPVTATREEVIKNPRSRSAKLRIFEKI